MASNQYLVFVKVLTLENHNTQLRKVAVHQPAAFILFCFIPNTAGTQVFLDRDVSENLGKMFYFLSFFYSPLGS